MSNLNSPPAVQIDESDSRHIFYQNRGLKPHLLNRDSFAGVSIRNYQNSDVKVFCSWVTNSRALRTVSGDSAKCLTPDIFLTWVDRSVKALVLYSPLTDDPLGFCTLSSKEIPEIPDLNLEICHLLVKPTKNYFAIGHYLCMQAKSDALLMGYKYLWGRVVPWNGFGKCLAERQLSKECNNLPIWIPKGFHWYMRDLSNLTLESQEVL
jgi:hypothetical protein